MTTGTPRIKVFRGKEYVASCHYFEDAAAIAALTPGTIIKWERRATIWHEGKEKVNACDSIDQAAIIMLERVANVNGVWKGRYSNDC